MQSEWLPTIQYLVAAPHPTVFTTYNENEMKEETLVLQKLGAKFTVARERNKWRGLGPNLEVLEEKHNKVYFLHQYWYVIAGRGS
jgi:splicing suppressor protein 51